MATTAAIIAGVGAAAGGIGGGVASSQGSKKGGGVSTRPTYMDMPFRERALVAGLRDLFGEERAAVEAAVGQYGMLSPELYRELGFEPTVEDRTGFIPPAQARVDELRQQQRLLETRLSKFKKRQSFNERELTLELLLGQDVPSRRGLAKAKKKDALRAQLKTVTDQLRTAEAELGDLRSQPVRITGLNALDPDAIPATSFRSSQNAARQGVDLTLQQALAALRGETPVDPTLLAELDRRERLLHEQLRRQLGPDYATSTPGAEALTDWARERAAALEQYNRTLASTYLQAGLAGEGQLANLTANRLETGTFLPRQGSLLGLSLGEALSNGRNLAALLQQNRQQVAVSKAGGAAAGAGLDAATGSAIGAELGRGIADYFGSSSTGGGAGAGAYGAANPYGGGQPALDYGTDLNAALGRARGATSYSLGGY